jgi:tetratricopeptide (TPR) repeat protein
MSTSNIIWPKIGTLFTCKTNAPFEFLNITAIALGAIGFCWHAAKAGRYRNPWQEKITCIYQNPSQQAAEYAEIEPSIDKKFELAAALEQKGHTDAARCLYQQLFESSQKIRLDETKKPEEHLQALLWIHQCAKPLHRFQNQSFQKACVVNGHSRGLLNETPFLLLRAYCSGASTCFDIALKDKALDYFTRALQLMKALDEKDVLIGWLTLAETSVHIEQGKNIVEALTAIQGLAQTTDISPIAVRLAKLLQKRGLKNRYILEELKGTYRVGVKPLTQSEKQRVDQLIALAQVHELLGFPEKNRDQQGEIPDLLEQIPQTSPEQIKSKAYQCLALEQLGFQVKDLRIWYLCLTGKDKVEFGKEIVALNKWDDFFSHYLKDIETGETPLKTIFSLVTSHEKAFTQDQRTALLQKAEELTDSCPPQDRPELYYKLALVSLRLGKDASHLVHRPIYHTAIATIYALAIGLGYIYRTSRLTSLGLLTCAAVTYLSSRGHS